MPSTHLADAGRSPDHLKQVIQALAEYLRYSLENRNKDFIPLGREIDAIRNYLIVEKARFRGDLEIECRVDESTRSLLVPGIVIQPLIENAIKYGRRTSPKTAAKWLGIPLRSLNQYVQQGLLPSYKLGRHRLFRKKQLVDALGAGRMAERSAILR